MERIHGSHIFEMSNLDKKIRKIIENIFTSLENLHSKEIPSNKKEIENVYIGKTFKRLKSVSKIIPNFSSADTFTINGLKCKNYFLRIMWKYLMI